MTIPDGIFNAYDIRGLYPEELDEAAAERIGCALAQQLGATSASADPVAAGRAAFSSAGSRALARTFLFLALLLLVAETLVARRGSSKPAPT